MAQGYFIALANLRNRHQLGNLAAPRRRPALLFQQQLLLMQLFLLLELHVFLNHLTVQTHGVHAVALDPEMITPEGLFPHVWKNIEELSARLSAGPVHQLSSRDASGV